jgi:hypothetical protein
MFIYSMETFIAQKLNLAQKEKDSTKVQTLGPFACALDIITTFA